MITWTIFQNHLLEIGLTLKNKKNKKITRPYHYKIVEPLIYCILTHVGTPHEYNSLK